VSRDPRFCVGSGSEARNGRRLGIWDRHLDSESPVGSTDDAIGGVGMWMSFFHGLHMVRERQIGELRQISSLETLVPLRLRLNMRPLLVRTNPMTGELAVLLSIAPFAPVWATATAASAPAVHPLPERNC
jgi:hypothetical protein